MSKSIIIEVDEATKSILELLESKITNGVNTTFQSFKIENHAALQGLHSQIYSEIQELGKKLTKDHDRIGRKLDDLLNDLEDQLDEMKNHLMDSEKEQAQLFDSIKMNQEEWNKKLFDLRNDFTAQFQKQNEQMNKYTKVLEQKWEAQLAAIVEKASGVISQQQEEMARLADKQSMAEMEERLIGSFKSMLHSLDIKKDIQLLANKQEMLEKELALANQTFYKKWFGKKGEQ